MEFLRDEDSVGRLQATTESAQLLETLAPSDGRHDDRREDARLFVPRIVDVDKMHW
jgi:hypothetical protein